MSSLFPVAADDSSTLPDPSASAATNSPSHSSIHANANGAIKAIEAKLGTGASTPTANTLLFGNGTGTSAWTQLTSAQLAASLSDETGTGANVFATSPSLVTPKMDTIAEVTPANGVTIDGLNIKDGALTTANSTPVGSVVQVVATNYSAVATGTTLIPFDDTIPQITEGTEFMTQAITPKSATNILVVEGTLYLSYSITTGNLISALFQDTTANALAVTASYQTTATGPLMVPISHSLIAGTTSSTTFRIRGGSSAAGTMTINGQVGARVFGATTKSWIKITEYKA